jgi:hypothetical protein
MNLFEYIAQKFSPVQKSELYSDKAVCLTVFRVAFGTDKDLASLATNEGEEEKNETTGSVIGPNGL